MTNPPDVTVILLRHGDAPVGNGGRDRDRPLGDGIADRLRRGAKRLSVYGPIVALVSAARRTQETADAVLMEIPLERRVDLDVLYNADADVIRGAIVDAVSEGAQRLLVVGHNPGISGVAYELSGGDGFEVMRPGDAVTCERRDGSWRFVDRVAVQAD